MITKVTAAGLAQDAADFLAFKRAMGMSYRRAEFDLNSFVCFVRQRYGEHRASLEEAVTLWATRAGARKAITVGNEFGVVRQLCLFRRRSDPRAFVPEHAVAPVRESVFVPYIFSHEEVLTLIGAASRHEGRNLCGTMLRAFTLVLYCTGMRLGEATRLRMEDVDLRRGILMSVVSQFDGPMIEFDDGRAGHHGRCTRVWGLGEQGKAEQVADGYQWREQERRRR